MSSKSVKSKAATATGKKSKAKDDKDKESDGPQRATWTEQEEFDLLDKYFEARNKPELATDKGLKTKAWNSSVELLNARHKRKLDKEQCKSKFGRIMHAYDLYKHITGLSGADVSSDIPTLDDDVWDQLIKSKPKDKSVIKQIRKVGFPHATSCCLIAGDTRAIGDQACTIPQLLNELDDNEAKQCASTLKAYQSTGDDHSIEKYGSDGVNEDDGDVAKTAGCDLRKCRSSLESKPASHQQRIDNVKRIRGGASKNKRPKKKAKGSEDSFDSVMRTMKMYLKLKMEDYKERRRTLELARTGMEGGDGVVTHEEYKDHEDDHEGEGADIPDESNDEEEEGQSMWF
ncbi:hypothetical protein PHYBOEH_009020 [Phytophthora boehmeriae]|uniref:Myb/SANT-like domain-containing protein n=1 Tax=Phytophthora boehmeriae TaxID=109152 RepID=A0A8T1X4P6_9STRA|nr:hypothetical protein PHYBOEH_009020 [Phytophthora boehmeriae]